MIFRELKDPRLEGSMTSVTAVDVTNDGSYATVYLSVFKQGAEEAEMDELKENVLTAMRSAKGYLKREIGKQIRLKHMPELIFKIDTSFDYGRHMDELITKVIKEQDEK
jgi:ribosome-binding factor A